MSRAAARLVTVVTLSAVIGLVAPTASAADGQIIIRIYDTGAAPPDLRAAAIRAAAAIFEEAGVAAAWYDCTDGLTSACQTPRSARDLIVRIMPTSAGTSHIPGAAELHANIGESDLPLGFAVVDPSTRSGAMATIFHDQVLSVARRSGTDSSELLGRTLAHEVGHLLLRAMGHSRTGLMRAVWTDAELIMNRHDDWVFGPHERRQFGR
jgi:hypothetical protein